MQQLEAEVANRKRLLRFTQESRNFDEAEHKLWTFQQKHFGIAKGEQINVGSLIEAITKVLELNQ